MLSKSSLLFVSPRCGAVLHKRTGVEGQPYACLLTDLSVNPDAANSAVFSGQIY